LIELGGGISVEPVWFDSMGAKSSCVFVRTPDASILIDPGAAEMQPSFPMPASEKARLCLMALRRIRRFAGMADCVVISHYHYDHHILPESPEELRGLYAGKTLLVKDPNRYINASQWSRARLLFEGLYRGCAGKGLKELSAEPEAGGYPNPMEGLPEASALDYGPYRERKAELLRRGMKWFEGLSGLWSRSPWIPPLELEGLEVRFADGASFDIGGTRLRFSRPFFHGVEFDRVGWVISVVVERSGIKVVHSSDLQGPTIEDYASWIIEADPDLLFLDGPPTYMLGYALNRINLERAIENAVRILSDSRAETIVYDHHLLRDRLYERRVGRVYEAGRRLGKGVLTAAELFGLRPAVLEPPRDVRRGGIGPRASRRRPPRASPDRRSAPPTPSRGHRSR
jgi:predicted metallo-beta-lactamase superfamily hydrolase